MKLYIVRHAEAIERGGKTPDAWRYLTPQGRSLFRKTAKRLRKMGVCPEYIITSPLLRAVQTADILAEALTFEGPLVVAEELAAGFDRGKMPTLLAAFPQARGVVLVGHEPDLSALVHSLLGLPHAFKFRKGGVVALKYDPAAPDRPAVFKWMADGSKDILLTVEELLDKYSV
ncbi:MAG: phosphohistidine [Geobacteraceae bacterium]|nr:MAG: phosphohistidine [Geobacteraceae bacterium]